MKIECNVPAFDACGAADVDEVRDALPLHEADGRLRADGRLSVSGNPASLQALACAFGRDFAATLKFPVEIRRETASVDGPGSAKLLAFEGAGNHELANARLRKPSELGSLARLDLCHCGILLVGAPMEANRAKTAA